MTRLGLRARSWLYVGTAFAGGSWALLIAWFGRDKSCAIDGCFWDFFLFWVGLAVTLLATVAVLVRQERTQFPARRLALISISLVGAVILALIVVSFVDGLEERAETTIGLATLFVLGVPFVFILASAIWLFFSRRE